ncbi:MAG: VIT1/CCC1 transporter family protein [Patescibacteria group bacterium]
MKSIKPSYLRNVIFGAEDSLVSTVGVLFGVSTALPNYETIVLTGFVVIAVEALSMGAGAYLSEIETEETLKTKNDTPVIDGLLMFVSYFFAGFIPLAPYVFFEIGYARLLSVALTIFSLFILGYIPQKSLKAAIRMAVVASLAVLIGFLIGNISPVNAI